MLKYGRYGALLVAALAFPLSAGAADCGLALSVPTRPMSSALRPPSTIRRRQSTFLARGSWRPSRAGARSRAEPRSHRGFQPAASGEVRRRNRRPIAELCARVDGVLLTSVDGRVHLAQAREIIKGSEPMFIDKPLAATLDDAREIARLAKEARVPWFSTSTLRYSVAPLKTPDLNGVDVWGPGPFEEHHQLDLSWYAIHEAEMLFTLLGTGCEEVTRVDSADATVVGCRWKDGRIGTMRALRPYSDYGVVLFLKDAKGFTSQSTAVKTSTAELDRQVVEVLHLRSSARAQ